MYIRAASFSSGTWRMSLRVRGDSRTHVAHLNSTNKARANTAIATMTIANETSYSIPHVHPKLKARDPGRAEAAAVARISARCG